MTVSNTLGAGFLESVYSNALAVELTIQGLEFAREKPLDVRYKQHKVGAYYADFVVEGNLIVELKALSGLVPEHKAQVMNYLRASKLTVGLLLNFGTARLEVQRVVMNHNDSQRI